MVFLSKKEGRCKVMSEELLTTFEVARLLRVDPSTIRRWIKEGTLEGVLLPRRGKKQLYRIRWKTLNDMLQDNSGWLV